jgi:hypothetical protein
MMIWVAYATAWAATGAAVTAGVYITGSGYCLWALLIPAMVEIRRNS